MDNKQRILQCEEKQPEPVMSRRSFLKKSLGLGGLLLVGDAASFVFRENDCLPEPESFSFIYRSHDFIKDYVIPLSVFAECIKLGKVSPVTGDEIKIAQSNLEPIIREELARRGLSSNCDVKVSKQYYGKIFDGVEVDDAMQYSSEFLEFMKSKVVGLDTAGISFHKLRNGEDWTQNYDHKVFFGDYYITVLIAEVKDGSTLIMDPSTRQAQSGAMSRVTLSDAVSCVTPSVESFAFIPAAETALAGVPSEVIPWTTMQRTSGYFGPERIDEAIEADETIAEGMSHIISLEFGKIKGVPAIEQRLARQLDGMVSTKPQYKYLRDSIKWLQRNGIQAGFDLYMENPQKYLDAISRD